MPVGVDPVAVRHWLRPSLQSRVTSVISTVDSSWKVIRCSLI